ncbi:hypothetical protein F4820DRAFT_464638, partial [Hypoxylon rubiginosum]
QHLSARRSIKKKPQKTTTACLSTRRNSDLYGRRLVFLIRPGCYRKIRTIIVCYEHFVAEQVPILSNNRDTKASRPRHRPPKTSRTQQYKYNHVASFPPPERTKCKLPTMSYSESVYSGMVPWQMRSENNPRYRPLAAFARCKSMDLPRELNDEEQAKKDDQERRERGIQEFLTARIAPPPKEEESDAAKDASAAKKTRQESNLAVFLRSTTAQLQETRDHVRVRYARAAFALDARLYWAGRWYRERSVFPELFYVLRYFLKVAVAVALAALLVGAWWRGGGREEGEGEGGLFVYEQVPQYRVWSVSKPRCDCDADGVELS